MKNHLYCSEIRGYTTEKPAVEIKKEKKGLVKSKKAVELQ